MNGPREELFAGTGFAANQNRRITAGDLGHSRQDGGQRGRGADNLFEHRRLVDFLSKRDVFLLESLLSLFAVVDIGAGDVPMDDLAIVVAHRVVASEEPAIASVTVAATQLQLKGGAAGQRTICIIIEPFGIVRMNFRSKASLTPRVEANAVIGERRSVCIQALTTGPEFADDQWREIQHLPELRLA